jgi:hypothetical protein
VSAERAHGTQVRVGRRFNSLKSAIMDKFGH